MVCYAEEPSWRSQLGGLGSARAERGRLGALRHTEPRQGSEGTSLRFRDARLALIHVACIRRGLAYISGLFRRCFRARARVGESRHHTLAPWSGGQGDDDVVSSVSGVPLGPFPLCRWFSAFCRLVVPLNIKPQLDVSGVVAGGGQWWSVVTGGLVMRRLGERKDGQRLRFQFQVAVRGLRLETPKLFVRGTMSRGALGCLRSRGLSAGHSSRLQLTAANVLGRSQWLGEECTTEEPPAALHYGLSTAVVTSAILSGPPLTK